MGAVWGFSDAVVRGLALDDVARRIARCDAGAPLYADHFVEVPVSELRRELLRHGADPLCADVRPGDCLMGTVYDPAVFAAKLADLSAYAGIDECRQLYASRYGEECGSSVWRGSHSRLRRVYRDIGGREHEAPLCLDDLTAYMVETLGRRLAVLVWRLYDDEMWMANVYAVRVRLD